MPGPDDHAIGGGGAALKQFVWSPDPVTPLEALGTAITNFPGALLRAASGTDVAAFADRMVDTGYLASFLRGFITGMASGTRTHLQDWLRELRRVLEALRVSVGDVGELTVVGITEQFVRPLFDDHPRGLLPQSEEVLAGRSWIEHLASTIDGLQELFASDRLLEILALSATDLVDAWTNAGGTWIRQFLFQTGLPQDQGLLLGELIGGVAIEVVRMALEPAELGVAEIAAALVADPAATP